MTPPALPRIVAPFPDPSGNGENQWLVLARPRRILSAHSADEVPPLLREADAEIARGNIAAGFVCYESAPAFDAAQPVHSHPPTHPSPPLPHSSSHPPPRQSPWRG